MIQTIQADIIIENVKEMCIEANYYLSANMDKAMKEAVYSENPNWGKRY